MSWRLNKDISLRLNKDIKYIYIYIHEILAPLGSMLFDLLPWHQPGKTAALSVPAADSMLKKILKPMILHWKIQYLVQNQNPFEFHSTMAPRGLGGALHWPPMMRGKFSSHLKFCYRFKKKFKIRLILNQNHNSVWCQINRKCGNKIQILFHLTRLKIYFFCV